MISSARFAARSHVVLLRADAKNMFPRRRALNQAQQPACVNAAGRPCCSQACPETGAAGCAPHSRPGFTAASGTSGGSTTARCGCCRAATYHSRPREPQPSACRSSPHLPPSPLRRTCTCCPAGVQLQLLLQLHLWAREAPIILSPLHVTTPRTMTTFLPHPPLSWWHIAVSAACRYMYSWNSSRNTLRNSILYARMCSRPVASSCSVSGCGNPRLITPWASASPAAQ